jgi:hypothetical protein
VSALSVDFKHWIKIGSPHFIVYTDVETKEAVAVLRELEMLHEVAQTFFHRQSLNLPPTVIVLPTSHSDWRKIESKGDVEWRVAVSEPAEIVSHLILVQYDWQGQGMSIVRAAQGQIEMVAANLKGPFWYKHGVGSFFETAEFSDDTVLLGRQNQRSLALGVEGWLPWDKFLAATATSAEFTKEREVARFDAQCALTVQFMLTNPEPGWFERGTKWAALAEAGHPPTESEFKAVFGQDWKEWQKTMSRFFAGGRYQMMKLKTGPAAAHPTTVSYELPVREVRELFVLCQILNQNIPASDLALESILAKGLKTESLRELLAEACLRRRQWADEVEQLKKIITEGTQNPAVYVNAAAAAFREAAPRPTLHSRLGSEAATIAGWCRKALEIEPRYREANELLAWTEALGPTVDAASIATLERLYRSMAGDVSTSDVVAALAVARWRTGDLAWARTLSRVLGESPYADTNAKEIAAELSSVLGPAPAASPPAPGGAP